MAALNENAITRLATVHGVNLQNAAKTTLFTVPAGKTFIPVLVVVRNPSATLAGGTHYDFGTGDSADTWRQGADLSSMTTVTDFMAIMGTDAAKYAFCSAGSIFGIKVVTGSTGPATATVDVFGYLV